MPVCFDDMRTLTSYPNRITLVNIVAHAIERDPAIEDATKLAVRRRLEKEFEASVLDLARWDAFCPPSPCLYFSPKSLIALAQHCGFELLQRRPAWKPGIKLLLRRR